MPKTSESVHKKLLAAAITATKARDIKDLLDKGADINAHNEWGLTPVMLAAQYNHSVAVLNALIAAGADIHEAEPKYRSNALHLAANSSKNPKVIEALLAAGANIEARNYLGTAHQERRRHQCPRLSGTFCSRLCKGCKENIPCQSSQGEWRCLT